MVAYIVRRLLIIIPYLVIISILAFLIIQLQPGNCVTRQYLSLGPKGAQELEERLGLNRPPWVQYLRWIQGIITRGDFGISCVTQESAAKALFTSEGKWKWTLLISAITLLFCWFISLPIGIYSATRKYSVGDHFFSFLSYVGLSVPNFILALVILWFLVVILRVGPKYGLTIMGILDPQYMYAPWTFGKLLNFLWHVWPAILVIGAANMAGLVRYMRGSLLDILGQPYVQTARAKGLTERIVIYKHAVRNAINPLISILGFWIPYMFEGALVAAVVLDLPTVEKGYWNAITTEDQYLIMTGLLFFGAVLFVGNLISDLLLVWADPKIRYA